MRMMRTIGLAILLATLVVCLGLADEDKTHPEVKPAPYEWSLWMSPSTPPGDQFNSYAGWLFGTLPALQIIAQNGLSVPTVDLLHTHAQLIIHSLEGSQGEHANPALDSETVDEILDPIDESLRILNSASTYSAPGRGIIVMRGGMLWVIDWALPQLSAHAQEAYPLDPLRQRQIVVVGEQIQSLMLRARDAAVACIKEQDIDAAASYLLDVNAYLFAAVGAPFSSLTVPVSGMGLYYLTFNLLGWNQNGGKYP